MVRRPDTRSTDGGLRARRVGRDLQRRLALVLAEGVDPALPSLVLTRVHLSADLSHARVYYLVEGAIGEESSVLPHESARRLAHLLRQRLARGWRLRRLPELVLVHDEEWRAEERVLALLGHVDGGDTPATGGG